MVSAKFNKADSNAKAIYVKLIRDEDCDTLRFRIVQKGDDAIIAADIMVYRVYVPYTPKNRMLL